MARSNWVRVAFAVVVLALTMCSSSEKTALPRASNQVAPAAAPVRAISAPIDLSHPGAPAALVFRAHNGAFTFAGNALDARASDDGSFAVTPHATNGAPPAFTFATTSIGRAAAFAQTAKTSLDGAHLTIDRGVAREYVVPSNEGIEQTWTFANRPSGSGDLVVRVSASGEYAGRTAGGHHLRDPKTHLGLRYGDASWIDAAGARSEIAVTHEPGAFVLRVPAAIAEHASYPATLDPMISAEVDVDQPSSTSGIPIAGLSVATDGTNLFYVWTDNRTNLGTAVYGLRVNGQTLQPLAADGKGFLVGGAPTASNASVTYDGTNFVVAWQQTGANNTFPFYAARVSPSGAVLTSDVAGVALGVSGGTLAGIAYDGVNDYVVWNTNSYVGNVYQQYVYGMRLDPTTLTARSGDAGGVVLSSAGASPVLAAYGGYDIVGWTNENGGNVAFERISAATGAVSGAAIAGPSIYCVPNAVAYDGTNFLLVSTAAYQGKNYYARVAASTWTILPADTGWRMLAIPPAPADIWGSSTSYDQIVATYDGTNFVLALDYDLYEGCNSYCYPTYEETTILLNPATGNQITQTSTTPGNVIDPNTGGGAQIIRVGSSAVLAWTYPIKAATIDPASGNVSGSVQTILPGVSNFEVFPAVAFDGTNYAVTWGDARGSTYAARVSPATNATLASDDSGIVVPAAGTTPVIAFGGGSYLIADYVSSYAYDYQHGGYGEFASFTLAGLNPTTGAPFSGSSSSSNTFAPSIAYGGGTFLVAWDTGTAIESARVVPSTAKFVSGDASGHALSSSVPPITSAAQLPNAGTSLAFDGTNFLAAWKQSVPTAGGGSSTALYAARIDPSTGAVRTSDAAGVAISHSVSTLNPALACAGTTCLAVWADYENDIANGDIYGARIDTSGATLKVTTLGSDLVISNATGDQSLPAVVDGQDGLNFQVVWQDRRSGTSYDIYGALVSYAGVVQDPQGVAISADPINDELAPKLASQGNGAMLVAYSHFDPSNAATNTKVRARFFSTGGTVAPAQCTSNLDCASRLCVDSYCCNTACTGSCETCAATPGTCTPVTNGEDSDTCSIALNGSTCDANGVCGRLNGQSAASAGACVSGFLANGICCDQACDQGCGTCVADGHVGTCTPLPSGSTGSPSCVGRDGGADSFCDGVALACPKSCRGEQDCPSGMFCQADGFCVPQVPIGGMCNTVDDCVDDPSQCNECADSYCVDGYCCNSPCDGQCEACDVPGNLGSCQPVVNEAPHNNRAACTSGDGDACGVQACTADSRVVCSFVTGTSCRAASCDATTATETLAATCANGACGTLVTHPCSPYGCNGDVCATMCVKNSDCAAGATCNTMTKTCESGATCSDAHTLQDINGVKTACDPYACAGGRCTQPCASISDCANGYVCDSTGACVEPATAPPATNGCSCGIVGTSRRDFAGGLLAICGIALATSRRRKRITAKPFLD